MTLQNLALLIPYIVGGLFILGLILFVLSLVELRRGRTGPYWRLRRQAGQRGGRLFLTAMALFGLSLALAFYSGLASVAFRNVSQLLASQQEFRGVVLPSETPTVLATETARPSATPTATASPSQTATQTPTPTSTPTPSTTPTSTPTPTSTMTPTITLTPSPTFESVLNLTPPPSSRKASESALIQITAADHLISLNQTPIEPGTVFSAGVTRIYLFILFQNMDNGVPWSRVLYRDGVAVQGQAYLWSQGTQGTSYFFFGNSDGYEPGTYEVRIYVGSEEVSQFTFQISI